MSEENKQVLNEKTLKKVTVSPAQLRYATTLFYLGLASFIIMLVTYFLYVSGVTTPLVPLEEMPKLWVHRSAEYLARAHIPHGELHWHRSPRQCYPDLLRSACLVLYKVQRGNYGSHSHP